MKKTGRTVAEPRREFYPSTRPPRVDWIKRNSRLILAAGEGSLRRDNERRNVAARANLLGLFDYKVCARKRDEGFDCGSLSVVDCLTCKLRRCLLPFALLAPRRETRGISNAMKRHFDNV